MHSEYSALNEPARKQGRFHTRREYKGEQRKSHTIRHCQLTCDGKLSIQISRISIQATMARGIDMQYNA